MPAWLALLPSICVHGNTVLKMSGFSRLKLADMNNWKNWAFAMNSLTPTAKSVDLFLSTVSKGELWLKGTKKRRRKKKKKKERKVNLAQKAV